MVGLEPNGARPPSPADATQQPSEAKPEDAGIAPHAPKLSLERLVGDAALQGTPGSAGNSDIHQPEMDNPDGNVGLTGDVSLNTTAWDYAPWLQRYCRELMHRWIAPPAYTMGILKEGGWALIEVEISPRGKLLRCDLLDEQGHPALIIAAQGAVRSVAPIEPLPAGFPEPTLILRLRMIYPRYPGPETDRAPNSSRDPRAR
jgi:hypothetical protein